MLIGILSDTHISSKGELLPPEVREVFQGVDLILHGGDIYVPSTLDELETIAPVLAALGDDDSLEDPRVKPSHILNIEGVRIQLVHYYYDYYPFGVPQEYMEKELGGPLNVVISGHTHMASIKTHRDALLVSPGSPTLPNYRRELGSVALMELNSGHAEARIVELAPRNARHF